MNQDDVRAVDWKTKMVPLLTLFQREVHRFLKVIMQTILTPFVSSLLYLLVFGVTLGNRIESQMGVSYLVFLIPGLCMMGLMNNAFQNSSSSISIGKFTGELEELKTLPLSVDQIVWAMSAAAVVRGLLVATVTYIVGFLVHYLQSGEFLTMAHPFAFFYFLIMGGLIFGCLGIATAIWAKNFDQISAITSFVLLPLTYLGGVFISIEVFSPFWRDLSHFNPLLYLINGLRYGMLGVSDVNIGAAYAISIVGFVILYFMAKWSLAKASFTRW